MGNPNARPLTAAQQRAKVAATVEKVRQQTSGANGGVAPSLDAGTKNKTVVGTNDAGINHDAASSLNGKTQNTLSVKDTDIHMLSKHKWAFVKKVKKQTGCEIRIANRVPMTQTTT
ncbi:hypothetical protein IFR05_008180 [Cadophora sp. M221]|nr:hypothetical protein IFR05_008180 [Cadophora sp. M221]